MPGRLPPHAAVPGLLPLPVMVPALLPLLAVVLAMVLVLPRLLAAVSLELLSNKQVSYNLHILYMQVLTTQTVYPVTLNAGQEALTNTNWFASNALEATGLRAIKLC